MVPFAHVAFRVLSHHGLVLNRDQTAPSDLMSTFHVRAKLFRTSFVSPLDLGRFELSPHQVIPDCTLQPLETKPVCVGRELAGMRGAAGLRGGARRRRQTKKVAVSRRVNSATGRRET